MSATAAQARDGEVATAASPTPSLPAQVAALQRLTVGEMREKYRELFGEETKSRNRVWLFRTLAWQVQALAEGGLSERAKRRAAELVRESDVRPRTPKSAAPTDAVLPGATKIVAVGPIRDSRAPLPGTVLVRDYKGQQVVVRVLDDGFEWNGRVFGSLSAVAKAVTGSHWSGTLFFGLKKAKSA